jgi:hypothetical protein
MVEDAQLYYSVCNQLQLPAALSGRWLAATDSQDMGFHTAVYPFITSTLTGLCSEDCHTSFTELPADALHTFGRKMIGFADGTFTLSADRFITCQQHVGCTDGCGSSFAFNDHRFQLLTFLCRKIYTILNHLLIPPSPKVTDMLAFLQH